MTKEIWKDIPKTNGKYQVSNMGRVVSFKRSTPKILCEWFDSDGYPQVSYQSDNKRITSRVHRLVAICFLEYIPNGYKDKVVDHINEIKTDNRSVNLRLISHRTNVSRGMKSKSGLIGVRKTKYGTYTAAIEHNYKKIHIGTFETKEEAHLYYKHAIKSIMNGTKIKIKNQVYTSAYMGVSWYKPYQKWQASYYKKGKTKHLGYYKNEDDANNAMIGYIKSLG